MADRLLEARVAVEDVAGEGPIAFPELHDSLRRIPDVDDAEAVRLSQTVLREYLASGRISVYLGRALDANLVNVSPIDAAKVVDEESRYCYGDGDAIRAWFSLDP